MIARIAFTLAALMTVGLARAESHSVQLVNNCGQGNAVFLYQGNGSPQGSATINGQVLGGIAWIDGGSYGCQASGANCGAVEFTLTNPSDPSNTQNAADYTLLDGPGLGNHQFKYNMDFAFTGSCTSAAPGTCTGDSAGACPGAYLGSDTTGGTPVQCVAADAGIQITFC